MWIAHISEFVIHAGQISVGVFIHNSFGKTIIISCCFPLWIESYFICGSKANSDVKPGLEWGLTGLKRDNMHKVMFLYALISLARMLQTLSFWHNFSVTFPGLASDLSCKIHTSEYPPVDIKLKREISQSSMCCGIPVSCNEQIYGVWRKDQVFAAAWSTYNYRRNSSCLNYLQVWPNW